MADMKLEMGWMKYVEMLEIAESRGVPAQFDAELCGLIAKSIRHKEATIEAQEAEIKRLNSTIEFVKRWVQRVHDKETTLEEFYSAIRYDEVFKPVEAALAGGE